MFSVTLEDSVIPLKPMRFNTYTQTKVLTYFLKSLISSKRFLQADYTYNIYNYKEGAFDVLEVDINPCFNYTEKK